MPDLRSPYEVLGVKQDASADAIRQAFRRLAKQNHPDLNPGNREAEARFKEISIAHDILSDPDKRARFDRGEIDASGAERPEAHAWRRHAEGPQGAGYAPDDAEHVEDLEDLFANFFAQGGGGPRGGRGGAGFRMRGADRGYTLTIAFLDSVNGGKQRLTLPDGVVLDVAIPPGIADRQVLRLRGKGAEGLGGGPSGDALIEVRVTPHPVFRRDGRDIRVELPVTVAEAVLGAKVPVPTITGPVTMTIPPRSDSGTTLRLRGRGVPAHGGAPAGDQYVVLKLVVGPPDPELERFLRERADRPGATDFDPRAGMGAP